MGVVLAFRAARVAFAFTKDPYLSSRGIRHSKCPFKNISTGITYAPPCYDSLAH